MIELKLLMIITIKRYQYKYNNINWMIINSMILYWKRDHYTNQLNHFVKSLLTLFLSPPVTFVLFILIFC